ncbi:MULTISPECIES: HNH endonuclease family protein [unclassified Mycolicibacterium]|uniref:HNH endonuclease family protein n=1 Tax=unclassified Mycolicibacterium TaxID=2636767 RepID=UPI0012DC3483|nr:MULTISPECIES: HNH endonuclease family protein [unclassified Mycolicibacterium]MUL80574.1 HNH endonuclease [Mycolicibacterium sp. CBMA 329]MUL86341.1 HNH endonuclease [Mycolicibacterium sp. CBMA 331]MUM03082.1 HNH endonuclease [Mycolicibacterium sp. CBMA 334]MUM26867.1 HNH endonuclease [Mycolicibacterium sp. CBMA 295]MUM36637.1 HNH endonuclease [Mycolicibacterium sp. CBMA 247]
MTGRRVWWLAAAVVLAVVVAIQVAASTQRSARFAAQAQPPTVAPGVDLLAGVPEVPVRVHGNNYRRAAFGEAWDDDNSAPGGHNGCDTRNDILNRDLADKTFVAIKRCPVAVATGTLHDPYTNAVVSFARGNQVGASVQIDHIVPLALAWDLGARDWPDDLRLRFANDPANLLAVAGKANQDKGDREPAHWMPPNRAFWCQYAVQFTEVLRGYALPVDAASATVLREAAGTCPTG